MLRKHSFRVYLIDESKTSSICPICSDYRLESCHDVIRPRPYIAVCKKTDKKIAIKCHSLLRCKNLNRMRDDVPLCKTTSAIPWRYWSRDLAAIRNFMSILDSIFAGKGAPERFRRCHQNSAPSPQTTKQQEQPAKCYCKNRRS
ncbi:hypothetical protein GGI26_004682 [Coemansia sp. RSA 1358]|nr:hypothetical protein EDC05_004021 [Coemansia umbellata]KAJ2620787.1 hypothetical protein GGI26_004682 [Coemansia sp. RSA 1358]